MRIGIRSKLVLLMLVVGVLPLTASLLGLVLGARQVRIEGVGTSLHDTATAESRLLALSLQKDVERLIVAMHEAPVVQRLSAANTELTPQQRDARDAAWSKLRPEQEPLKSILESPISAILRLIQGNDPRIVEMMVTDRFGQQVATTGNSGDYYQADEDWWQGVYNSGDPQVFIPPIAYDAGTGHWTLAIGVPIRNDDGTFVGVARAEIPLARWMSGVRPPRRDIQADTAVIQADGQVLWKSDESVTPYTQAWPVDRSDGSPWRLEDGRIQATSPLEIPGQTWERYRLVAPRWLLVAYVDESQALAPLQRVSMFSIAAGILAIGVLFLAGLHLANRSILTRIGRMVEATRKVSGGDLSARIDSGWKPLMGRDELDDLAADFNQMVARVQSSQESLRQAAQMKDDFILVASHELRTPVSYVVGLAKLLKDNNDAVRLKQAVASMGEKAEHLGEIIQAMMRLAPGQALDLRELDVASVLKAACDEAQPFAQDRRQRLVLDAAESLPRVRWDQRRVMDILQNLVMNAIKFTPDHGTVTIRASEQLGSFITISVADQGPGVPAADLPHLFEPFFAGGEVLRHSSGRSGFQKRGMGLGLATVRHFAQMHGGTVHLTTSPAGSVFSVTLPIVPPQRPDNEQYAI
jgi:signal transduction histidine kinase